MTFLLTPKRKRVIFCIESCIGRFKQPVMFWSFKMLAWIWLLLAPGNRARLAPCLVDKTLDSQIKRCSGTNPLTVAVCAILAIANTKKNTRMLRFQVPCGIVRWQTSFSGARAGVTGEACTYLYLYWFTFIIVRPAQWQPRKNDPLDYWSQLNVNWKLGNDVSAKIKPRKCGTGTCTICGNHAR